MKYLFCIILWFCPFSICFSLQAETLSPITYLDKGICLTLNDSIPEDTHTYTADSIPTETSILRVQKKEKFIDVSAGKTTVQVENNDILSSGSVWEALEKLPGVVISPDGQALLNGTPSQIWLDGEPTGLSGEDLTNFLNSLPANSVEKIEIISSPGSKYDANTEGGIINIITGKNKLRGTSGSINSVYARNNYDKLNNTFRIGTRLGPANLNLVTGYAYTEDENQQKSSVEYYNPVASFFQEQTTINKKNNFFIRSDNQFKISRKTNFSLKFNLNTDRNNPISYGSTMLDTGNDLSFTSNTENTNKSNRYELTTLFSHDFLKKVKYNLSANYTFLNSRENASTTELFFPSSFLYNYILWEKKINNLTIKQDFELKPNVLKMDINTGIHLDFSHVNSNGEYDLNNTTAASLPTFDSFIFFMYKESNLSYYIEGNKKIKQWRIGTGIRAEYLSLLAMRTDTNETLQEQNKIRLFPTIDVVYEFNKQLLFSISYRRKINRIGYDELDPNISSVYNQLSQEVGNPTLVPSINNKIESKLSFMNYLSINLSYNYIQNPALYVIKNESDYTILRTRQSFDYGESFSANFTFPLPFGIIFKGLSYLKNIPDPSKMSFIYFQGGLIYSKYKNAEAFIPKNKALPYIGIYSQILLPWKINLNLFYLYFGRGTYQTYYLTKANQGLDISLSKSFLNKKLKIQLFFADIFNTKAYIVDVYNPNLALEFQQKKDTRYVRFSVTYNFGKIRSKNSETSESLPMIENNNIIQTE